MHISRSHKKYILLIYVIITGKTIQVLAFFAALYERHDMRGPHLVVMPLSVMSSWKGDLRRFVAPGAFELYVHHGEKYARQEEFLAWYKQLKKDAQRREQQGYGTSSGGGTSGRSSGNRGKISLVLTTYEIAMKDEHLLRKLGKRGHRCPWQYMVVSWHEYNVC